LNRGIPALAGGSTFARKGERRAHVLSVARLIGRRRQRRSARRMFYKKAVGRGDPAWEVLLAAYSFSTTA
jgi:hypothetical protein